MPEEFLDGSDVMAVFQEMGRERVPEGVGAAALGNARLPDRIFHGALEDRLVQVVAPALAREPIAVDARGGEDPLPPPVPAGVRVLARQRVGQLDPAGAVPEVSLVLLASALEVGDQRGRDRGRQHRHPIFAALAVADDDLVRREVDVLHA